ncbi:MAG: hypothetical protein CMG01_00015 [Candidatus Marinimicrobia bacterium]|nr:hypothetical protein [Candidatus Neomarinimicrobiota bacterium]|tara:strand:+ start:1203 stop:3023 length:1821 start_codon:yes stop_codon:yes gene_type:complete
MNIIIPLGGIGKRFHDNNYTKPKPLIKVLGKEIIFWLLENLNFNKNDKVFIPYNEFLDAYSFEEIINDKFPNINLLALPPTNGPSDTVKRCLIHFKIKGKIVLLDGDTWYKQDILSEIRKINKNLTVYFKSKSKKPIYSYIKKKNSKIIQIAEKVKISDYANTGCYVFNSSAQVLRYINKIESQGEIYISNIILEMLKDNINFDSLEANDFHVLGTPQQIIEFSKRFPSSKKRFVFDLDNTLVTFPMVSGDYSTVKPISKTINYVRNLKKDGHYIIIYTARRMRTHNGNVEKVISDIGEITIKSLKKFKIPYDEIIFGKPYAHYYIDDLMINPKTDLNKEIGYYMENVEPRHFNKLHFNKNTVTKTSKYEKLDGESYFYKEITKFKIKKYFPKLISSVKDQITIERISGSNFSTLYINEILNSTHVDKLFDVISKIHNEKQIKKFNNYYDYDKKLVDRYKSFDYDRLGFSKKDRDELHEKTKKIKGQLCIIHGDLVFSNIILNNYGDLIFIDVKGKKGNELTIFGDKFYDFAKIYQSLIGYDEILLEKNISKSYKTKMIKHFEDKFTNEELSRIKIITKSLLISLIPLHNEKNKFKKYVNLAKTIN